MPAIVASPTKRPRVDENGLSSYRIFWGFRGIAKAVKCGQRSRVGCVRRAGPARVVGSGVEVFVVVVVVDVLVLSVL